MSLHSDLNRTSDMRSYLYATFLWLALVVVFFWPVLFQNKVLAPLDILDTLLRPWAQTENIEVHNSFAYDAISQYLPYDWSAYQSLRQDGYIGWNPYTHSGSSIVENTMLCPGDWHHHLYRFLPFWDAWDLGIVLQFAIAGLGMLVFLRHRNVPAAYALIAVISFAFYSQFAIWIYHRWILGAMCWSPWILWSLFRMREKRRILDPLSAVFIGLAFRGGHLQTCIFVVLLVCLVALADWWQQPERWKASSAWRTFLPYAVSGLLGTMLALDVIMETVPALLHGKRVMPTRGWIDGLISLPTLVTTVFPGVMGTPQGLDSAKIFRSDLFSIKFLGAFPLFLACLALLRRQAPLTAKVLFVFGFLIPFTPADQWLYSRFTVVFALGAAWLASWQLFTISREPTTRIWRRALVYLLAIFVLWTGVSIVLTLNQDWIQEKFHSVVRAEIPASKAARLPWMLDKADQFLKESMVWWPRNLAMFAFIAAGIGCCTRIHSANPRASAYAVLAALCAFGEITLFSTTWITFSKEPASPSLYAEADWIEKLRESVPEGTILCSDRSDFDYMQLNTPSSYGIRFAEGYETVTPKRIQPPSGNPYDPKLCAESGVSHILAPPDNAPEEILGFEKTVESPEFVLYRNTSFIATCMGQTEGGTDIPLDYRYLSPNRRLFSVPGEVSSVTITESYNPGWQYSLDGQEWDPVDKTPIHSIRIKLPDSSRDKTIRMRYRPQQAELYRPAIALTIAGLACLSLFQLSRRLILQRRVNTIPTATSH